MKTNSDDSSRIFMRTRIRFEISKFYAYIQIQLLILYFICTNRKHFNHFSSLLEFAWEETFCSPKQKFKPIFVHCTILSLLIKASYKNCELRREILHLELLIKRKFPSNQLKEKPFINC